MTVIVLKNEFSICKLPNFSSNDVNCEVYFCAKTKHEYSLVCPTKNIPANAISVDKGWRAFRIAGNLDFSLVGIMAKIASLLADNGISIFAVSTFNTDYILTKGTKFENALRILENNGYEVASNEE